jgi:predicted Rossmann fold flavoprotein
VSRGVRVEKETVCREIKKSEGQFNLVLQSADKKWELMAAKVILAAGGKTYPALGADGTGFSLAEKFGHKIISPVPSGVPLEGKDRLAQELQGLKLPAEIRLSKDKKVVGDLLFTKYGLSGMAVLLSSRILSRELNSMNKKGVQIELNFMPDYNLGIAIDFWLARKEKYPSRLIEVDWAGVFPTKFAKAFLKLTGLAGRNYATVSSVELKKAVKLLVAYPWHLTATRGWNEAEFTAGGVDCTEINPSTLESKKIPGLYFAGEIMDIDGDIGGYNLSWAWASGFVAGKTA